jgi:hypothetical protein
MEMVIYTTNNFSIKNITENHIEIINYGFNHAFNLKLYEINYDHVVKYPNINSLNLNNYSVCDDVFSLSDITNKCG